MNNRRNHRRGLLALVFPAILAGCSIGDRIGVLSMRYNMQQNEAFKLRDGTFFVYRGGHFFGIDPSILAYGGGGSGLYTMDSAYLDDGDEEWFVLDEGDTISPNNHNTVRIENIFFNPDIATVELYDR